MTKVQVIAPRPEMLLRLEGDAAHGRPIEHLRIEGIGFEYTDWVMPRNEVVDGQSAMFLKTATVFIRGVRDCVVERCEIAHIGGYALRLEHGCKDNRVVQCHMHDLGAGGVLVGEQSLPQKADEQTERNEVVELLHPRRRARVSHGRGRVDRPKLVQQGAAQRDLRFFEPRRFRRLELGIRPDDRPS